MLKRLEIRLATENAAFRPGVDEQDVEIGRILIELGTHIREGVRPNVLVDRNGNAVGAVRYVERKRKRR